MRLKFAFPVVALIALTGCNQSSRDDHAESASETPIAAEATSHEAEAHAHPEHGPHGGELIELGKEAYHAEMVHDDQGVTLYLLDSSATKPVSIDARTLTVNMKHDGKVQTFDLLAVSASGDSGEAFKFTSNDAKLREMLDAGAEGAVVIQIDGQSYTGKISHDHDHEHDHADEHDHEHADEHDHAAGDVHEH